MDELLEKLAAIEHEQWMAWSKAVSDEVNLQRRARWIKLWVPYEQLPDDQKEGDRKWAQHAIDVIASHSSSRQQDAGRQDTIKILDGQAYHIDRGVADDQSIGWRRVREGYGPVQILIVHEGKK